MASKLKGRVNITGPIGTIYESDTYPTFLDVDGKGGYRCVSTVVERDAIPALRRSIGMLVFVEASDATYQLRGDGSWGVLDISVDAGTGYVLNDLDLANLGEGFVLEYDGTNWVSKAQDVLVLSSLQDVADGLGPVDGDNLVYDGVRWIAATPTAPVIALADIGDFEITVPDIGETLEWNGSRWVNTRNRLSRLQDVTFGGGSIPVGDVLMFTGDTWEHQHQSLLGLSDTVVSEPIPGEALIWNGTGWVNGLVEAGSIDSLASVEDVNLSGIADGGVLRWDETEGQWVVYTGLSDYGTF